MSVPPGWFPDPAGDEGAYRWWDGRGWTRWLGADPQAGAPSAETPATATATDVIEPDVIEPDVIEPDAESLPAPPSGAPEPAGPALAEGGQMRVPIAIALVVGVLVVALVVVGLTVVLTEDRIRTGPALPPPSAADENALTFEKRFRTVRIQNVSMDLPGTPYECNEPKPMSFAFANAVACDALIHRDYAGTDDWYASAGFGLVRSTQVVRGDNQQTAENLYRSLIRLYFLKGNPELKNFGKLALAAVPVEQGLFIGGDVHYTIKGLPSTYDRFVLGVFPLPNGDYAAFFSVRPNDTSKSTLDVLNGAIATMRVR